MKRCTVSAVGLAGLVIATPAPAAMATAPSDQTIAIAAETSAARPAALSPLEELAAGAAPVVDVTGTLLAASLDSFASVFSDQAASTTDTSTFAASPAPTTHGQNTATAAFGPCTPFTGADNPHVSSTEFVASALGWWRNGTCNGTTAQVRTCLLEWWRNSNGVGQWVVKKCNQAKIKAAPTGTRKPSVTARATCNSAAFTGWANLVDVDVDGVWDSSETGYKTANIYCRRF